MKSSDEVRSQVKDAYTQAISQQTGCCGDHAPATDTQAIGYTPEDISGAGQSAASASLGCGNPLAFGEVQPGETVLDLGSGAGLDLLIAAEKVGSNGRVIGVDMTPRMIATAWKNIADSPYRNIEVRYGIIEDLPVADNQVDWVISNCVINLSPEKEKVFSEIHRVLKPGGHFSISDIVVHDFPEALRDNVLLYNSCVAGAISEEQYVAGLRAAGFIDVAVNTRVPLGPEMLTPDSIKVVKESGSQECCGAVPRGLDLDIEELVRNLSGKVQSLNFIGRKPDTPSHR